MSFQSGPRFTKRNAVAARPQGARPWAGAPQAGRAMARPAGPGSEGRGAERPARPKAQPGGWGDRPVRWRPLRLSIFHRLAHLHQPHFSWRPRRGTSTPAMSAQQLWQAQAGSLGCLTKAGLPDVNSGLLYWALELKCTFHFRANWLRSISTSELLVLTERPERPMPSMAEPSHAVLKRYKDKKFSLRTRQKPSYSISNSSASK